MTPPPHDPSIETRLLIIAEMLDQAVHEVRRVMNEVRASGDLPPAPYTDTPLRVELTIPGVAPPAVTGPEPDEDEPRSADVPPHPPRAE